MEKQHYTSPNFNGKIFVNTETTNVLNPGAFISILPKFFKRVEGRLPKTPPGPFTIDSSLFNEHIDKERVTWLWHSSVLIEMEGIRLLTDPAWGKFASPVPGFGPKRFFSSPVDINKLPLIDYILLSHDHYDHLDKNTIREFGKTDVKFICSLGVGKWLRKWKIDNSRIKELDWWDEVILNESLKLILTPARHFSGRGTGDRNTTLWGSFTLIGKSKRIFFGADSGYFDGFKIIGEKYGPFDLTMLEIGASSPYWPDIHMGPEKAMKAHTDLQGKLLLPIHWGTFNLAMHPWKEPVQKIIELANEMNQKLLLPVPGKINEINGNEFISRWWDEF